MIEDDEHSICPTCNGTGIMDDSYTETDGTHWPGEAVCEECEGTGLIPT